MALTKQSAQFRLVESAVEASKVPFVCGQYIIVTGTEGKGTAFYDPSTGTVLADRITLSPDLTSFLTKSATQGVFKDLVVDDTATTLDVTVKYEAWGEDGVAIEKSVKKSFTKATALSETDTKIPTAKAVYEAIQAAITAATAKGQAELFEVTVAASSTDTAELAKLTGMKQGDIAVCTSVINGDITEKTAYIYSDSKWVALSGNVSAENVYFPQDLLTTSAIGNITLSGGQATIAAGGKNLLDTWEAIFVKETNTGLKTGDPKTAIAGADAVQYIEVGSSASKTVTMSMTDDGSYKYGYTSQTGTAGTAVASSTITNNGSTGVAVDATTPYSMTYKVGSGTATAVTASGTNKNTFVVNSGVQTAKASATISGTMKYGAGKVPVSNLKKMYPAQAIAAGTATASKEIFRWYVPMFHGFKMSGATVANPAAATAADISSLTKDKDSVAYSQTKRTSDTASGSWMQYFIAVPSSYNYNITGAKDTNNLTLDIKKGNKVSITLGTATVEYQVWYINNAAAYDTKGIVITW